jgi:hypothetical protein
MGMEVLMMVPPAPGKSKRRVVRKRVEQPPRVQPEMNQERRRQEIISILHPPG